MIYIFGHKNPDSDSVCSAIGLSALKNALGYDTKPFILGEVSRETEFILSYFGVEAPEILENVKTQVRDIPYQRIASIRPDASILRAYNMMESGKIRTLPVCDDTGRLKGLVTMKDVAMGLISRDHRRLNTNLENILETLEGEVITPCPEIIDGEILVMALFHKTVRKEKLVNEDTIAIVGDNYLNIELCIEKKVKVIIITGDHSVPVHLIEKAEAEGVGIVRVTYDTYATSKRIDQANYVKMIMREERIARFKEKEYLEDVFEAMLERRHTNYPVVGKNRQYLGMIGRRQMIYPKRKEVILVDHNEYSQSAEGIEEASILEIIDHHKIGSISTNHPITFRNMPVGSTCTIVYQLFREYRIDIEATIAGILMSGILSDTLFFKSPTTSSLDRDAVEYLNGIANIDLDDYVTTMFKRGTSLEGKSIESIVNTDYKTFESQNISFGISQIFTLDIEDVFNRREQFLDYLTQLHESSGQDLTLLMITDIMKEGSYLLYASNNAHLVKHSFGNHVEQGAFVEKMVSRKKQTVPMIMEGINMLQRS